MAIKTEIVLWVIIVDFNGTLGFCVYSFHSGECDICIEIPFVGDELDIDLRHELASLVHCSAVPNPDLVPG